MLKEKGQGNWSANLARVTASMNNTPKEVLHGEAPNDVNDNKEMNFMLLQDNNRKIKRNNDIAQIKERALQTAGNTFRAPLTVDKVWTK